MAPVAHVNRLSDDLLIRIWRCCHVAPCNSGSVFDFRQTVVPSPPPYADAALNLTVASVCRRWRRLARKSVTALLFRDFVYVSQLDLTNAVASFPNLTHLYLGDGSVDTLDDAFLAHLASSCRKLTALHVGNDITPMSIRVGKYYSPSRLVRRKDEHPVTETGVDLFLRQSPQLQHLSLFCIHPDARLPPSIFRLTNLLSLDLSDEAVLQAPEFQHLSSLTALSITCARLEFEHLSTLARLTNLATLSVACPLDRFRLTRDSTAFDLAEQQSLKALTFNGSCPSFDLLFASGAPATRLEQLRIANCNDLARLPEEIDDLMPNLRSLTIYSCDSFSLLPVNLTALNRLDHLDFFSGYRHRLASLPDHFERLTALKTLVLQESEFTDLPRSLCQLPCLEEFTFSSSSIRHLPAEIGRLTSLRTLSMHSNINQLLLPASFSQLVSLTSLDITGVNFQDSPVDIGRLSRLEALRIRNCNIRELPESFAALASLQVLTLSHCKQLTALSRRLDHFKRLRVLKVACCELLAGIPESLPSSLETLKVDGLCFRDFSGLPKLRKLRLRLNGVERGEMISSSLAQLTRLELDLAEAVTQIPLCVDFLPQLRKLVFLSTGGITELPSNMGWAFPRLRKLRFVEADEVQALPGSITQLQHLTSLKFFSAPKLASLPRGIGALTNLSAVCLFNCPSLYRLPDSFTQLRALSELEVTNSNIRQLPSNFCQLARLRRLSLSCCWKLAALPEDLTWLTMLQELHVGGCSLLLDRHERVRSSAIRRMYGLNIHV